MNTIKDLEPAFPRNYNSDGHNGMTLRDYFAATAMHALIVEPPWNEGSTAFVHKWSDGFPGGSAMDRFAFASYAMADAMLRAREAS